MQIVTALQTPIYGHVIGRRHLSPFRTSQTTDLYHYCLNFYLTTGVVENVGSSVIIMGLLCYLAPKLTIQRDRINLREPEMSFFFVVMPE